jgi:glyoxylase I family protein
MINENKIIFQGMAPLIQVFDMPTSLKFYRDLLGFEVTQRSGAGDDVDWVLLRYNNIEFMLNTAYEKPYRPPQPDKKRIAFHQDVSFYFGCPDVLGFYHYLIEKGVKLKAPAISGYGFLSLEITDPDGFNLIFHWHNQ